MSEPDFYATARTTLDNELSHSSRGSDTKLLAVVTMALVEEQRTANLLTFAIHGPSNNREALFREIRARLDLRV